MTRRAAGSRREIEPGKWRLDVSAGFDPMTGTRRRPSKVFYGTEREAELELGRMLAQTGRGGSGSSMTLWQFIETMYLPAIEPPELRRTTVDEYRRKLEKYVKPAAVASMRMDKIDRYAMVSWMRWIKTSVPNRQTQLHIYRTLSAALGKAVAWGCLEENLLTKAVPDAPVPDEVYPTVLTAEEVNLYLDAFSGHGLEPVVVLAVAGGFRPSEIYGLDWSDIDFDARTVSISKGLHQRHGEMWLEDAKSRQSRRVIVLPEWAIAALRAHRGLGRVCGDLTPNQVSYRYRQHVSASGLSPWCPLKNLRHTSATISAELGVGWDDLARRLGHSSHKMLQERYVKRWQARDATVADAMETLRAPTRANGASCAK